MPAEITIRCTASTNGSLWYACFSLMVEAIFKLNMHLFDLPLDGLTFLILTLTDLIKPKIKSIIASVLLYFVHCQAVDDVPNSLVSSGHRG